MKKIFYLASLCLFAVSCGQTPNQLKLTGTGISSPNDILVYELENEKPIDTIKVSNGAFTYTCELAGEPRILLLMNNSSMMHFFITEPANLTLAGDTGTIQGSPLNDRLAEVLHAYRNTGKDFEASKTAIFDKIDSEQREMTAEEMSELQSLDNEARELYSKTLKSLYEDDKNTPVGVMEMIFIQAFITDEEFAAMYAEGGKAVQTFQPFIKSMEAAAVTKATQPGAKFVDFEGVNPKDATQSIKLSDFAGKDKYVLVDFWASWCGPCRKAMPAIKALHDKYASKGLVVIGAVISDKIADHLEAAEALGVTWTQIFDSKKEIGSKYGIKGIPTLLLIDRDGTILTRTHDGAEIVEKVHSLLGK